MRVSQSGRDSSFITSQIYFACQQNHNDDKIGRLSARFNGFPLLYEWAVINLFLYFNQNVNTWLIRLGILNGLVEEWYIWITKVLFFLFFDIWV